VLVRTRHDGSAAGLLYLDLDPLQQVNDSLATGRDDLLPRSGPAPHGRSLRRPGGPAGGDEFVLVLETCRRLTGDIAPPLSRRAGRVRAALRRSPASS